MGDLIPSTRIGGGSLMDAISQGKHYLYIMYFFVKALILLSEVKIKVDHCSTKQ